MLTAGCLTVLLYRQRFLGNPYQRILILSKLNESCCNRSCVLNGKSFICGTWKFYSYGFILTLTVPKMR